MINANNYGFKPSNDAYENSKALQFLLEQGGEIQVLEQGVYDLSETLEIKDDTTLIFGEGVTLRRQPSKSGRNGIFLVNNGVKTGTYNRNIKIIGLHLNCNGVESDDWGLDSLMVGLRSQIGLIYIKDLTIKDFECVGLVNKDYAIQITAFENLLMEDIYIEGNKDGIHLGWGKNFTIRRGVFCTFDDPIALNAFDYSTSSTHVGWIENGLIEDCCDKNADATTGFFCRLLAGAWCEWKEVMQVQHSDTVCANGRIYRVVVPTKFMTPPQGQFISYTMPTHTFGVKNYDGINWAFIANDEFYDCGCRNIVFRNIKLQKKRSTAIAFELSNNVHARSFVKNCKPIPQSDILFENVSIESEVENFITTNYPVQNIKIKNTDLKNSKICFNAENIDGLVYPTATLIFENVKVKDGSVQAKGDYPFSIIKH